MDADKNLLIEALTDVETDANPIDTIEELPIKRCKIEGDGNNSRDDDSDEEDATCISVGLYVDEKKPNVKQMHAFFLQEMFCDITLVTDDKTKIPTHRVILCAANPFFTSYLSEWSAKQNKQKLVLDSDVRGEILYMLVEYCYTGRITITNENVDDLLHAAHTFEFRFVKKKCAAFLQNEIGVKNSLHIWRLADVYQSKRLQVAAAANVCDNFLDIIRSNAFQKLDQVQLLQWLNCDDIFVGSEEDVFKAIVRWISFEPDERIPCFPTLFKAVRLTGISYEFLNGPILKYAQENNQIDVFVAACKGKAAGDKHCRKPRTASCLLAVGGTNDTEDNIYIYIEQFCNRFNSWKSIFNMPDNRQKYSVVYGNEQILFVGGCDPNGLSLAKVSCLNISTMTLLFLPDMTTPRHSLCCVFVNNEVFAIGGQNADDSLDSVEKLDSNQNVWQTVEPMSTGRSAAAAVVFDEKIYVIGGRDKVKFHDAVEYYSPETNRWTPAASLVKKRSDANAVVADGRMMVIGGYDGTVWHTSIEIYNPRQDTWEEHSPLGDIPLAFGVVAEKEWIYVAGGLKDDSESQDIFKFNAKTNHVKTVATMQGKGNRFSLIHCNYFAA